MIPENIQKEHILSAIKDIDLEGIPTKRISTKWNLVFNGNSYPPKYVISLAGKHALGKEYSDKLFSGGPESNDFLTSRGFSVRPKEWPSQPFESYSWTIESNSGAYKLLDKSAFLHRGTGVPINIRPFFLEQDMQPGGCYELILELDGKDYNAHIDMEAQDSARTRLFWNTDFASAIKDSFPFHYELYNNNEEPPSEILLHFVRVKGYEKYRVTFTSDLNEDLVSADIKADMFENFDSHDLEFQSEGRVKEYYGKRYERSPKNRKEAIRIHGLCCKACGFNFEKTYGERGASFIEVHHVKPIHTYEEEQTVDPYNDLIPVCSNCHRIIHRNPKNILTVDQVKALINQKSLTDE